MKNLNNVQIVQLVQLVGNIPDNCVIFGVILPHWPLRQHGGNRVTLGGIIFFAESDDRSRTYALQLSLFSVDILTAPEPRSHRSNKAYHNREYQHLNETLVKGINWDSILLPRT